MSDRGSLDVITQEAALGAAVKIVELLTPQAGLARSADELYAAAVGLLIRAFTDQITVPPQ